MYLLNIYSLELEQYHDEYIPPYAILSHTWGAQEVSFQDLQKIETRSEARFAKVKGCGDKARSDGYQYVWIDTCCIDKSSSAELSEAINSMYRWYQQAQVCYAYLGDVTDKHRRRKPTLMAAFKNSRWFTRGWTLQELLAPKEVIFYDAQWTKIGCRSELEKSITKATRIEREYLNNQSKASVAAKMSWASERKTSRLEDIAYCLLGLFNINMPLLYGEGQKSFRRLQEEILRTTDDESLFAWQDPDLRFSGMLAQSPAAFRYSGDIWDTKKEYHPLGKFRTCLPEELSDASFSAESFKREPRRWNVFPGRITTKATTLHPTQTRPSELMKDQEIVTHIDWRLSLNCCRSNDWTSRVQIRLQEDSRPHHLGFVRCNPDQLFKGTQDFSAIIVDQSQPEEGRMVYRDKRRRGKSRRNKPRREDVCPKMPGVGLKKVLFLPQISDIGLPQRLRRVSRALVINDIVESTESDQSTFLSPRKMLILRIINYRYKKESLSAVHYTKTGTKNIRGGAHEKTWPPTRIVISQSWDDEYPIFVAFRLQGEVLRYFTSQFHDSYFKVYKESTDLDKLLSLGTGTILALDDECFVSVTSKRGKQHDDDGTSYMEHYFIDVTIGSKTIDGVVIE